MYDMLCYSAGSPQCCVLSPLYILFTSGNAEVVKHANEPDAHCGGEVEVRVLWLTVLQFCVMTES